MKKPDKDKKLRLSTLPATLVLILIALLLVFVGYVYLSLRNGYTLDDLIDNIVGNLIGVLGAFLLFDIIYNKLTQDEYARDVSQQITKTLMGDPETLDAFDNEDKHNFLVSTIRSMMNDDDAVDMIVGHMDQYMEYAKVSRIRNHFNYVITLTTEFPTDYEGFPGMEEDRYFYVQENLNYEVKYLSGKYENLSTKDVKIGFSFDKMSLDVGLLETDEESEFSRCIFNENLDITPQAIRYLRTLPPEEMKKKYEDLFTAVLKIDDKLGELKTVDLKSDGIVATYRVDYDTSANEHSVRIIFHMPKLWDSIFEVTLVDPTREPKITFDYMPGKMDVKMYSYLNKGSEANDGAYELQNGLFDVSIKEEWIYPKSGIVFTVRKKQ
ncbi:MAG: hypothetical protein IJ071_01830 [Ruminococcus sp.]|nr:hypothetical protein [Ruminococcus sp.]